MEKFKKVSRAQWCLFALFIGFAFLMQNCQDDDALIYEENQTETELNARPVSGKVLVCRFNARKGTYSVVSVVTKRIIEGDVIIDADGDGYEAPNECNLFSGLDCDDTNAAINPGAVEICGDGIDNNCDGNIDEGCTYVPDDNFEQALIDLGYDTILDNYVLTSNINAVTSLNVNYYEGYSSGKIVDLTGIEDFTALTYLQCNENLLTSLDISNNTVLTSLYCNTNLLTSLDISNNTALVSLGCGSNLLESLVLSNNTALKSLGCGGNLLTSLDVSKNIALESLYIGDNQLTSIDVNANTALYRFECDYNEITSLDVSNNPALNILYCEFNDLTTINVSKNPNLTYFYCYDNQLTSLDVSFNTNLYYLYCSNNILTSVDVSKNADLVGLWIDNNQLTSLDVSQNFVLEYLECNNNNLTSLDVSNNQVLFNLWCNDNELTILNVKNGNNINFPLDATYPYFKAFNNPNLTCIQVDDAVWSTNNWIVYIDPGASFSLDCGY